VWRVFVPRKFQAKSVARVGGDLWGYLAGGREQADYYLGAGGEPSEAVAELHGRLWARLGVGRLDRAAFQRLAAGIHPLTGQRLVKISHVVRVDPVTGARIAEGGMHVPGIDCNLSPPKSVSVLPPFVSGEERAALEGAHLAAVRVTLGELERRVAACRPTINGEQVHTPGELGVAVFTHHTSRPTSEVAAEPGRPPDPQLHSHAFVFNLAFCQGRYLAVDSRPLYQFASTAEAIYACELASQLDRLGYELSWRQTRTGRTFEVAGVDQRLVDLFSSRHRHLDGQVAAFLARRGRPPTLAERCRLAAHGRAAKTPACQAPHWPAYHTVLERHGLAVPTAHRQRQPEKRAPLAQREALVRARLLAPDGLTRSDATFDAAAVTKATYQAATGLLTAEEARGFLERFAAGPDLVPVATPAGPRWTTAVLLGQERRIVEVARAKAATRVIAPTAALLDRMASSPAWTGHDCQRSSGSRSAGWARRSAGRRWRAAPAPARPPWSARWFVPITPTARPSCWSRRRRRPPAAPPVRSAWTAAGPSRHSPAPSRPGSCDPPRTGWCWSRRPR
jgi:conjugative relaxase-like TrwC/TraI family protein